MRDVSRRAAIALGLVSGPVTCAVLAQENAKPTPSVIDIAIALPIYNSIRPITIGPSRHYHVVISNRSNQLVRLWDDHCSQGEFNLAFEVREGDGPKFIRRRGQEWAKNIPIALELQPGEHFVSECSFDPAKWELPWEDSVIGTRRVRMRAIYRIEPSEIAGIKGVWTGEAMSRYDDYVICDNRR
jgi:hypothetical protein